MLNYSVAELRLFYNFFQDLNRKSQKSTNCTKINLVYIQIDHGIMNPVFCTVTSTFLDPSLNDKVPLHDAAINFLSLS